MVSTLDVVRDRSEPAQLLVPRLRLPGRHHHELADPVVNVARDGGPQSVLPDGHEVRRVELRPDPTDHPAHPVRNGGPRVQQDHSVVVIVDRATMPYAGLLDRAPRLAGLV